MSSRPGRGGARRGGYGPIRRGYAIGREISAFGGGNNEPEKEICVPDKENDVQCSGEASPSKSSVNQDHQHEETSPSSRERYSSPRAFGGGGRRATHGDPGNREKGAGSKGKRFSPQTPEKSYNFHHLTPALVAEKMLLVQPELLDSIANRIYQKSGFPLIILTGGWGSGKTTLLRMLISQLSANMEKTPPTTQGSAEGGNSFEDLSKDEGIKGPDPDWYVYDEVSTVVGINYTYHHFANARSPSRIKCVESTLWRRFLHSAFNEPHPSSDTLDEAQIRSRFSNITRRFVFIFDGLEFCSHEELESLSKFARTIIAGSNNQAFFIFSGSQGDRLAGMMEKTFDLSSEELIYPLHLLSGDQVKTLFDKGLGETRPPDFQPTDYDHVISFSEGRAVYAAMLVEMLKERYGDKVLGLLREGHSMNFSYDDLDQENPFDRRQAIIFRKTKNFSKPFKNDIAPWNILRLIAASPRMIRQESICAALGETTIDISVYLAALEPILDRYDVYPPPYVGPGYSCWGVPPSVSAWTKDETDFQSAIPGNPTNLMTVETAYEKIQAIVDP